jgi:NAD(P)-dependent dehydrogenase (short-subunit alcohol dehydrogenase family)
MRTVAPAMVEQRAGSIVNLSSVAGLTGSPFLTAYAASKWAVRGMSKVAAKELAQFGVRVNSCTRQRLRDRLGDGGGRRDHSVTPPSARAA